MDSVKLNWLVDIPPGDHFFYLFCYRAFEIYRIVAVTGLSNIILPAALISNLHDWSGILLGLFVFVHLLLNRRWIIPTTKKILRREQKRTLIFPLGKHCPCTNDYGDGKRLPGEIKIISWYCPYRFLNCGEP